MLNALWFKANGGEQKYREYLRAMTPLVKQVGGRRLKSFTTDRAIIGEFDADLIFFVEYPNWAAFKEFATSPEYHKIAYLREESTEKSILIRCVRPERGFSQGDTI